MHKFVIARERLFPGKTFGCTDLGCSGGGPISGFLLHGCRAVGTDVLIRSERAGQKRISNTRLSSADAQHLFRSKSAQIC
jgi:hypothetical protein